jgi:hypothetical protein
LKRRISHPFAAVILQSDDWGFAGWTFGESAANALGYAQMDVPYSHYGFSGLETESDLENLFSVLESVSDAAGLPAIMQANYIVAAPDYEKITAVEGKEWHALELPMTPPSWHREDIVKKALEGISRGVWRPEYHGYSHCDIPRLLKLVKSGDPRTQKAFALDCLPIYDVNLGREYASDSRSYVKRGLTQFQKNFGYRAVSSAPPNYYISIPALTELRRGGIKVLQGIDRLVAKNALVRLLIAMQNSTLGDRLKLNTSLFTNSPRDLDFEPRGGANDGPNNKHWETALCKARELLESFGLIGISMHRLNFVHHDCRFSREGLRQLTALLRGLVNTFPGLVFLTDEEYLDLKRQGFCISKRGNAFIVRNFGRSGISGYFLKTDFPGLSDAIRRCSNRGIIYRDCKDGRTWISIQPGSHRFDV